MFVFLDSFLCTRLACLSLDYYFTLLLVYYINKSLRHYTATSFFLTYYIFPTSNFFSSYFFSHTVRFVTFPSHIVLLALFDCVLARTVPAFITTLTLLYSCFFYPLACLGAVSDTSINSSKFFHHIYFICLHCLQSFTLLNF